MRHPRTDLWTGIARHGAGWRATVSQGEDRPLIRKHFPKDTDPREMQAWRADTTASLRVTRKQRATMGSFAFDAQRYLKAVTALPTYKERQREIRLWIDVFGTKDRSRITPVEIREWRDRWLTEPRDGKDGPPLAPGTVNKRLRALSNLFRVLDGPHVQNPVRSVPEAKEPEPEPKALDYATIARILAELPDADRPAKGKKRGTVSRTKIRLHCLAYCPITPKQLSQLTPADLDLEHGLIRLPERKKGRGARPIWQGVLPPARAAFQRFHEEHCYGTFSQSSLRKAFKSAARRAGITETVWPYRLRHAFGTAAFRITGSLETTGRLMQHRNKQTTRQYAIAAEAAVMHADMAAVAAGIGNWDRQGEQDSTFLNNSGQSDRPLKAVPTHSKGGNKAGRPRKSKELR